MRHFPNEVEPEPCINLEIISRYIDVLKIVPRCLFAMITN